jgi:hypothetical protein
MDEFDKYLNKNVVNNNNHLIESDLLKEKREEVYKFFTSTKTLIIVVAFWIGFVYSIYTSISSFGAEGTGFGSNIFSLMLTFAFGMIIPVGFYKLYSGSKKKEPKEVQSGLIWLITYFKIIKVLMIIVTVMIGIVLAFTLLGSFEAIVSIVMFAIFMCLFFYIIAIFKRFLEAFSFSFADSESFIPSPKKILTYLIVIFVLTAIGMVFMITIIENLGSYIPSDFVEAFQPILDSLNQMMTYFYVAIGISILSQLYFIYYVTVFKNTFTTFNLNFKKSIIDARRNAERKEEL